MLDSKTGEIVWTRPIPGGLFLGPVEPSGPGAHGVADYRRQIQSERVGRRQRQALVERCGRTAQRTRPRDRSALLSPLHGGSRGRHRSAQWPRRIDRHRGQRHAGQSGRGAGRKRSRGSRPVARAAHRPADARSTASHTDGEGRRAARQYRSAESAGPGRTRSRRFRDCRAPSGSVDRRAFAKVASSRQEERNARGAARPLSARTVRDGAGGPGTVADSVRGPGGASTAQHRFAAMGPVAADAGPGPPVRRANERRLRDVVCARQIGPAADARGRSRSRASGRV